MGLINPTYNNRVRFKLLNDQMGQIIAKEPIEWKASGDVEYTRSERYKGMFVDMSGSLTFVDSAADYLQLIKEIYGIQAKVQLVIEEKHPTIDKWVAGDLLDLDMSTYESVKGKFTIKIKTSGLYEILKSRDGEKVEIERITTLEGREIAPLNVIEIPVQPRNIFLVSKLETDVLDDEGEPETWLTESPFNSPPLKVVINSDQERILSTFTNTDQTFFVGFDSPANPNGVYPQNQQFFYYRNDRQKVLKLFFDFIVKIGFVNTSVPTQVFRIQIQKSLYNPDGLAIPISLQTIWEFNGNGNLGIQEFQFSNDSPIPFTMEEGECLALILSISEPIGSGQNTVTAERTNIRIQEDSFYEATTTKAILTHDLGQRLTEIITDTPDAFYSETLGRTDIGYTEDGKNALFAYAHGMWIRGFDKEPQDEENRYKAFTTSFKDWFDSISASGSIGLGIEKIGFKERIRIEDATYFFNKNITIRLGKATGIKRSYNVKNFFSSLEVGYSKGGEYEEAMGLDEYNAKSTFSTVITRVQNILQIINPFRADKYGFEFARRKPRINYPNEDSTYDQDIFMMDLKRFFNSYKERLWQDDFEQEPTGVYSPETATNLRLSPVNTLLRHGWFIASAFIKYTDKFTRYTSSTANSGLKTKRAGEPEYAENGDILNANLGRAQFTNEWIDFQYPVDFELMRQIKGRTNVNGKWIQNVYGMVEFTNEENKKEYGFLWSVKPGDLGQFKLLKVHI